MGASEGTADDASGATKLLADLAATGPGTPAASGNGPADQYSAGPRPEPPAAGGRPRKNNWTEICTGNTLWFGYLLVY